MKSHTMDVGLLLPLLNRDCKPRTIGIVWNMKA
jgi:hypothetical protein